MSQQTFIPPHPLKTPVLFLVYKRPDTTRQVFEAIRKAKPPRLYVASDGPKPDVPVEADKVQQVRDIVLNGVDWECEVKTLFREKNLGCKYGVSGGIGWFFENEEMGIILEDDTLPSQSFFCFCEELLERYHDDERIGIISGDNFQLGKQRTHDSYYFSRYAHIWGWASWRRIWREYDVEMKQWPTVKSEGWLSDILQDRKLVKYWHDIYDAVFNSKIDTWDYQLNFSGWINSTINIIPNWNLVSNIGFGAGSTHTTGASQFSSISFSEMNFPLQHPAMIIRDTLADGLTERDQFAKTLILSKIAKKIRRMIA